MEVKVFKFSESVIKERKRVTQIIQIEAPIFIIILIFVLRDVIADTKVCLLATAFSIILIETMLTLQSRKIFKQQRETEVIVNDTGIQRKSADFIETIEYKNIRKVSVREKKSGEVLLISISTESTSINIFGFENMEAISESIKLNIPGDLIKNKQNKIELDTRLVVICSMVISSVIILSIVRSRYHGLFNDLFLLTAGFFTLIYRPISKSSGLRYKKKETIFGILFIIFGLISFISMLFK